MNRVSLLSLVDSVYIVVHNFVKVPDIIILSNTHVAEQDTAQSSFFKFDDFFSSFEFLI